ncbi:unnamed protein product [Nyctereutes procyonoides]|uniref:(raccoon dog) hypothetical protein n=1 Tax=Nyctereutes procyonoides TaxID=34880 RepID=A0A811Y013_NYCPR|nr:unnamed protein product [Nyctereutes procyonoides]
MLLVHFSLLSGVPGFSCLVLLAQASPENEKKKEKCGAKEFCCIPDVKYIPSNPVEKQQTICEPKDSEWHKHILSNVYTGFETSRRAIFDCTANPLLKNV